MKRYSILLVSFLIFRTFLFAQTNEPSAPSAAQGSPSQQGATSDETAHLPNTSPVKLKVCSDKNPQPCVTPPRAVFAPNPDYPEAARAAHFQGVCVLKLTVGSDGRTHDITVARSLGFGLDEKAVEAVKEWRFEPATKGGEPVPVKVNVEVSFRVVAGKPSPALSSNKVRPQSGIILSPVSAHVVTSGQQQFTATVRDGGKKSAVAWSVSGSGCASSTCGTISEDGLYSAPPTVPVPAIVTITATLASDPARRTSAMVTIQSGSSP